MSKELHSVQFNALAIKLVCGLLYLSCFVGLGQVTAVADTTSIRIGEQIKYTIAVETDSTKAVVFPEGQTFIPMELVEALPTDTIKETSRWLLSKQYTLTQFDSGSYIIPQQKVIIDSKPFLTDSLEVKVATVVVDTTKQKLYDIKPIIEVDKGIGDWWKYVLAIILLLGIIAFLVYWFVWREKPLTAEEKIAQLPPYERAQNALVELDNAQYLDNDEIKRYYSELTMIIRTYLDEKVYNKALESTTDQLIDRLQLLKDANKIVLDAETIRNIEIIFKRADLVKFAKSRPDVDLARMDRQTIGSEIDHVKASLPEPTEEEKLKDLKYKEEQEKKKRRRQVRITIAAAVVAFLLTITLIVAKLGLGYTIDKITGDDALALLEKKDWVNSDYGAPPITIATPVVLERIDPEMTDAQKEMAEIAMFEYISDDGLFNINVSNTRLKPVAQVDQTTGKTKNEYPQIDLNQIAEQNIQVFENEGFANIFSKREQFITPNGQEGLKTYGDADMPTDSESFEKLEFIHLCFSAENVVQQITILWPKNNAYATQIVDRVVNSIELLKLDENDQ